MPILVEQPVLGRTPVSSVGTVAPVLSLVATSAVELDTAASPDHVAFDGDAVQRLGELIQSRGCPLATHADLEGIITRAGMTALSRQARQVAAYSESTEGLNPASISKALVEMATLLNIPLCDIADEIRAAAITPEEVLRIMQEMGATVSPEGVHRSAFENSRRRLPMIVEEIQDALQARFTHPYRLRVRFLDDSQQSADPYQTLSGGDEALQIAMASDLKWRIRIAFLEQITTKSKKWGFFPVKTVEEKSRLWLQVNLIKADWQHTGNILKIAIHSKDPQTLLLVRNLLPQLRKHFPVVEFTPVVAFDPQDL